jgi:hypothetical protein
MLQLSRVGTRGSILHFVCFSENSPEKQTSFVLNIFLQYFSATLYHGIKFISQDPGTQEQLLLFKKSGFQMFLYLQPPKSFSPTPHHAAHKQTANNASSNSNITVHWSILIVSLGLYFVSKAILSSLIVSSYEQSY